MHAESPRQQLRALSQVLMLSGIFATSTVHRGTEFTQSRHPANRPTEQIRSEGACEAATAAAFSSNTHFLLDCIMGFLMPVALCCYYEIIPLTMGP